MFCLYFLIMTRIVGILKFIKRTNHSEKKMLYFDICLHYDI